MLKQIIFLFASLLILDQTLANSLNGKLQNVGLISNQPQCGKFDLLIFSPNKLTSFFSFQPSSRTRPEWIVIRR